MYKIIGGDKQEYGPSSAEEIQQWIHEGRLNGQSFAKLDPDGGWQPLSAFAEFEDALRDQTGASPRPPAPPVEAHTSPDLQSRQRELSVSECLSRAWQLWMANFGLFSAASLMIWMIGMALQFLPFLSIVYWALHGVLYGGLFVIVLKRLRGEDTSVNEVFTGFGPGFRQLMLVGMTTSILSQLGFFLCVLPGIYLTVVWAFSLPIAADKGSEFWSAMEHSRRTVQGQWSKVFVLGLIAFLPLVLTTVYAESKIGAGLYEALRPYIQTAGSPDFAGMMREFNKVATDLAKTSLPLVFATKVALLANLPFGVAAIACAYETLLGKDRGRSD